VLDRCDNQLRHQAVYQLRNMKERMKNCRVQSKFTQWPILTSFSKAKIAPHLDQACRLRQVAGTNASDFLCRSHSLYSHTCSLPEADSSHFVFNLRASDISCLTRAHTCRFGVGLGTSHTATNFLDFVRSSKDSDHSDSRFSTSWSV
jgi:hypothetical protein